MKIFLLGFLVVALTVVVEAAQSDNGKNKGRENETKKSQLDMILEQQDQIQRLRIQTKEQELKNEELQLQLQDQQLQHQQEIKELRQELTRINRARRSNNETDEHLKELIRAEINPLIAGLSLCEVGKQYENFFGARLDKTTTIYFTRNFTRTPQVLASISDFFREKDGTVHEKWGGFVEAKLPTTTKFDLRLFAYRTSSIGASWIACA